MKKLGVWLTVSLAVLVSMPAVLANCEDGYALPTPGYVEIPGSGSYESQAAIPNFTPNAKVSFWSLDTGDVEFMAGDDSGEYTVYLRNSVGGAALLPYDYTTGTAMVTDGPGPFYNYSMTFSTNWGANYLIDGCIDLTHVSTMDRCTCLLMEDAWQGFGYFNVFSSQANAVGDFSWSSQPDLTEIPEVRITAAVGNGEFLVKLDGITGGVNNHPSCDCTPTGYKVYFHTVPGGQGNTNAPVDRNRITGGWELGGESIIGGADLYLGIDCRDPSDDLYFAASLTWAGGFETLVLSKNSVKAPCTTTLADPQDLDAQPKRRALRPLRPTRGDRSR